MKEKIDALRAYVNENYETRGFDWIAECWGQKEMGEFVAAHPGKPIERLKKLLSICAKHYAEREEEVRAEIW